jgi:hypothetical protein
MIDDSRSSPARGFLHPALLLAGLILAVALLLLPFALVRSGSGGIGGLGAAAAFCLVIGWIAEGLAWLLRGRVAPVGEMLISMAVRTGAPLGLCLFLAASGQSGHQHLAFIGYLFAFYFATLALETYLAVRRIAGRSSQLSTAAR